jgi:hypothetical protein
MRNLYVERVEVVCKLGPVMKSSSVAAQIPPYLRGLIKLSASVSVPRLHYRGRSFPPAYVRNYALSK